MSGSATLPDRWPLGRVPSPNRHACAILQRQGTQEIRSFSMVLQLPICGISWCEGRDDGVIVMPNQFLFSRKVHGSLSPDFK